MARMKSDFGHLGKFAQKTNERGSGIMVSGEVNHMAKNTESAIREAFLELLDEKPINKITVRDIVGRCGINRNTFYYHYQDIPSLVEEIATRGVAEIIAQYPSVATVETAMLAVVDFVEETRRAVLHLYNSAKRDILEQHLWQVCEYMAENYYNVAAAEKAIPPEKKAIIITAYKCECFGLILDWVRQGMKDDVRGEIHLFCQLRKGTAEEMIRRAEQG